MSPTNDAVNVELEFPCVVEIRVQASSVKNNLRDTLVQQLEVLRSVGGNGGSDRGRGGELDLIKA